MAEPSSRARQTLSDFLTRAIGSASVRGWAKAHALKEEDVRRAKGKATGLSLDKLQRFADVLHVEPWQLLYPDFTRDQAEFPVMSKEAIGIALELDKFTDPERRREVYATLMRVIGMGRPAEVEPALQLEPPIPSAESMRKPQSHQ